MSASLADSAGRLPVCPIASTRVGSPLAESGSPRRVRPVADWQPDILFLQLPATAAAAE
jgi:hypothetical protein